MTEKSGNSTWNPEGKKGGDFYSGSYRMGHGRFCAYLNLRFQHKRRRCEARAKDDVRQSRAPWDQHKNLNGWGHGSNRRLKDDSKTRGTDYPTTRLLTKIRARMLQSWGWPHRFGSELEPQVRVPGYGFCLQTCVKVGQDQRAPGIFPIWARSVPGCAESLPVSVQPVAHHPTCRFPAPKDWLVRARNPFAQHSTSFAMIRADCVVRWTGLGTRLYLHLH
jgi:hypothetical protein